VFLFGIRNNLFIYLFIYLLLKSYSKYKIDRDRNITHDTDRYKH